eukprot:TRINITY_DN16931_c0_g1_i1.p1 TRINITY_DN16931_c0_g1~~TRINITY_DN16931_c0_g1_i1.p1  ORF type:complete len:269 (-),score=18.40 TRINITY_DN16931_c0_g1_i1:7-813(-)
MSIIDPLGYSRIQKPGRGIGCTHTTCFDIVFFLKMNERVRSWKCPLCQKDCSYQDLRMDEYFDQILRSMPLNENSEVIIFPDGNWKTPEPETHARKQTQNTVNTIVKEEETNMNTSDAAIELPESHTEAAVPKNTTETTGDVLTIDLTRDSSDGEDTMPSSPPNKRPRTNTYSAPKDVSPYQLWTNIIPVKPPCKVCGRPSNKTCSDCTTAYCSDPCYNRDWPSHCQICPGMSKNMRNIYNSSRKRKRRSGPGKRSNNNSKYRQTYLS